MTTDGVKLSRTDWVIGAVLSVLFVASVTMWLLAPVPEYHEPRILRVCDPAKVTSCACVDAEIEMRGGLVLCVEKKP